MYTGKRAPKKKAGPTRVTRPFRPPGRRRSQSSVIPGLLRQTATEKKVIFTGDTDPINQPLIMSTTATIYCPNLIQVGSSMFNRIGRKVEMRSIRLVANIATLNTTRTTLTPDAGRIMVVYDRQTNGAFPAIADILQDTDQAGANLTDSVSGINMNNRERFVTLIDKKFTIPQATLTAGVLTNVFPNDIMIPTRIDEFRKLRGLTTHYKADSNPAVIGDIATGAIYILSLSQIQASGTELFNYKWSCRLKYVDV